MHENRHLDRPYYKHGESCLDEVYYEYLDRPPGSLSCNHGKKHTNTIFTISIAKETFY